MNAQQAGAQTRARTIRMIQRMPGESVKGLKYIGATALIAKIRTMDERQNKRKGGLGRK